jgi:hypothetical protein
VSELERILKEAVVTCFMVSNRYSVGFEVLTAVSMKMAVFWVVAPCSLVELYQTTRCYNPEDSNLQTDIRKKNYKVPRYGQTVLQRRLKPGNLPLKSEASFLRRCQYIHHYRQGRQEFLSCLHVCLCVLLHVTVIKYSSTGRFTASGTRTIIRLGVIFIQTSFARSS